MVWRQIRGLGGHLDGPQVAVRVGDCRWPVLRRCPLSHRAIVLPRPDSGRKDQRQAQDQQSLFQGEVVLYTGVTVEHRERAFTPVIGVEANTDVRIAEAEDSRQKLAAERALDSALADSFPASDPPSWTLGIARPPPRPSPAESTGTIVGGGTETGHVAEGVIDVSRRQGGRTFLQRLVSLAGGAGIALLVPLAILLVGLPIALAVRAIVEAIGWLGALIFG
jgi:hypothetical protein